jgi:hypothetical protein
MGGGVSTRNTGTCRGTVGIILNLPKLSPVYPKTNYPIAKKGELSITFFEIINYKRFQAKPANILALKRTLTDPFVQTISGPDDLV